MLMNKRFPLFVYSGWMTPNYSSIYNNNSINELYNQAHLIINSNKSLLFPNKNKNYIHNKTIKGRNSYKLIKKTSSTPSLIMNSLSNTKIKYNSSNLSPKNSFKSFDIFKKNNDYYSYNNKSFLSPLKNYDNNYIKIINKYPNLDLNKVFESSSQINNNINTKINNFLEQDNFSNFLNLKNNFKTIHKINSLGNLNKNKYAKNQNLNNQFCTISPRIEFQCYSEQNEYNTKNKNSKFSSISPQIRLTYFSKNKKK